MSTLVTTNIKNEASASNNIVLNADGTVSLSGSFSGNINFDNNTLYVDATNNRVGLGTSTVDELLHLKGGSAASTTVKVESTATASERSSIHFFNGSVSRGRVGGSNDFDGLTLDSSTTESAAAIRFRTGGASLTTKMTLTSGGSLGIGSNSPQSLLHLETDGTALRIVRGSAIGFAYNTGTAATDAFRIQSNGGSVDLYSAASQPITFSAGGTEKARFDGSGRLLVGTSSASSTANGTTNGALSTGGGGTVVTTAKQVANGGTLDITVGTSGIGYWSGFLFVNNINASSGGTRTQATYSAFGDNQAGVGTFTAIHTATGGAGQSFTITYVATGIIRFTNTSGSTCNVSIGFFGGGINTN